MGLELKTNRQPTITSQTSVPLRYAASLVGGGIVVIFIIVNSLILQLIHA